MPVRRPMRLAGWGPPHLFPVRVEAPSPLPAVRRCARRHGEADRVVSGVSTFPGSAPSSDSALPRPPGDVTIKMLLTLSGPRSLAARLLISLPSEPRPELPFVCILGALTGKACVFVDERCQVCGVLFPRFVSIGIPPGKKRIEILLPCHRPSRGGAAHPGCALIQHPDVKPSLARVLTCTTGKPGVRRQKLHELVRSGHPLIHRDLNLNRRRGSTSCPESMTPTLKPPLAPGRAQSVQSCSNRKCV